MFFLFYGMCEGESYGGQDGKMGFDTLEFVIIFHQPAMLCVLRGCWRVFTIKAVVVEGN